MPATPLAVNAGAVAIPDAAVLMVVVVRPPVNVPLAPPTGTTVNVTGTPAMLLPLRSLTSAPSSVPNGELMAVDCGVPPRGDAVIVAGTAV